jgi:Protein of unknown function (DUF3096)
MRPQERGIFILVMTSLLNDMVAISLIIIGRPGAIWQRQHSSAIVRVAQTAC